MDTHRQWHCDHVARACIRAVHAFLVAFELERSASADPVYNSHERRSQGNLPGLGFVDVLGYQEILANVSLDVLVDRAGDWIQAGAPDGAHIADGQRGETETGLGSDDGSLR